MAPGTLVKVHEALGAPTGILVKKETLDNRTPGVIGQICGIVPGHGGDVYWVKHGGIVNVEQSTGSAYGWWEFELVEDAKT